MRVVLTLPRRHIEVPPSKIAFLLVLLASSFLSTSAQAARAFCANWVYDYWDSNQGEDYLTEPGATGNIQAAGAWASVQVNGVENWAGFTNGNGCTPGFQSAGQFTVQWFPAIRRALFKHIYIYPNNSENWVVYTHNWGTLPAHTSGTVTHRANAGGIGHPLTAVAAAITLAADDVNRGLVNGTYKIYADQNCPGQISCFSPSTPAVFLGNDPDTGKDAFSKSVIGHEFGHYIQDRLMGTISNPGYTATSGVPECTCGHISNPTNAQHCLQSKEFFSAASSEGFGHFYASTLYNNRAQAGGTFAYYKSFKNPGGTPFGPPVNTPLQTAYLWQDSFCAQASRGVELDWLAFFYQVHTTTADKYSFTDLKSVYQSMCGGDCGGFTETWAGLEAGADGAFVPGSSKADFWINTGAVFGVDN